MITGNHASNLCYIMEFLIDVHLYLLMGKVCGMTDMPFVWVIR